jgi:hypothetical protein
MLGGCGRVILKIGRILKSVVAAMMLETMVATRSHKKMRFWAMKTILGRGGW